MSDHKADGPESGQGPDQEPTRAIRCICHRAANDLQTIINIAVMAAGQAQDPMALAMGLQGRIAAMGIPYGLISDKGLPPRLDELCRAVSQRLGEPHPQSRISLEVAPYDMSLRLGTALGLWLHEIVNNALIHGLAEHAAQIEITGGCGADGLWLAVRDHGPGPPPGFDPQKQGKLGLRICRAIADSELGGKLELNPAGPGLEARISIPDRELQGINRGPWT